MRKRIRKALGVLFIISGALLLLKVLPLVQSENDFGGQARIVSAAEEVYFPVQIRIPSVSIDLPIKTANVVKGKWEVFENAAAYGKGSGIPGQKGNVVVSAHARRGLFLPLKNVKKGESVYLKTEEQEYEYRVVDVKEVLPTDVSVIAPTDDETLTLYTCIGWNDSKRLVVVGKRVT